jgi:hypothetical protein
VDEDARVDEGARVGGREVDEDTKGGRRSERWTKTRQLDGRESWRKARQVREVDKGPRAGRRRKSWTKARETSRASSTRALNSLFSVNASSLVLARRSTGHASL